MAICFSSLPHLPPQGGNFILCHPSNEGTSQEQWIIQQWMWLNCSGLLSGRLFSNSQCFHVRTTAVYRGKWWCVLYSSPSGNQPVCSQTTMLHNSICFSLSMAYIPQQPWFSHCVCYCFHHEPERVLQSILSITQRLVLSQLIRWPTGAWEGEKQSLREVGSG